MVDVDFVRRAFGAATYDDDEQLVNAKHAANVRRLRLLADIYGGMRTRGLRVQPGAWPLQLVVDLGRVVVAVSCMGSNQCQFWLVDDGLLCQQRTTALDEQAIVAELYRIRSASDRQ